MVVSQLFNQSEPVFLFQKAHFDNLFPILKRTSFQPDFVGNDVTLDFSWSVSELEGPVKVQNTSERKHRELNIEGTDVS